MQDSMTLSTFSVLNRQHPFWKKKVNEVQLLSLRPHGSRDFEIGSYRQHLLFILLANSKNYWVSGTDIMAKKTKNNFKKRTLEDETVKL